MTFDPHNIDPESAKQIVRDGYDRVSYAYRKDDTPEDYGSYADWVRGLEEKLPAGSPVLDIGCGCGLPATKLLARKFSVTGVDISPVQIDRARQLVPGAQFVCTDILQHEFPPASFAAIVSFYAVIHMPQAEQELLFQRIANWLQPGGYLLVIVGTGEWTGTDDRYLDVEGGLMFWSHPDEATYLRWIADSGLNVQWKRFIPEGQVGHTLVFAQKPF